MWPVVQQRQESGGQWAVSAKSSFVAQTFMVRFPVVSWCWIEIWFLESISSKTLCSIHKTQTILFSQFSQCTVRNELVWMSFPCWFHFVKLLTHPMIEMPQPTRQAIISRLFGNSLSVSVCEQRKTDWLLRQNMKGFPGSTGVHIGEMYRGMKMALRGTVSDVRDFTQICANTSHCRKSLAV